MRTAAVFFYPSFFKCEKSNTFGDTEHWHRLIWILESCCLWNETILKIWKLEQKEQEKVLVLLWRWWFERDKANARKIKCQEQQRHATQLTVTWSSLKNWPIQKSRHMRGRFIDWRQPLQDNRKWMLMPPFMPTQCEENGGIHGQGCNGKFLEAGAENFNRISCFAKQKRGPRISQFAMHEFWDSGYWNCSHSAHESRLERATQVGMSWVILLETDEATLGNALISTEMDRSMNGCLFKQIWEYMSSHFVHCIISICSRMCNWVSHSLAAHGVCNLQAGSHEYMSQAQTLY